MKLWRWEHGRQGGGYSKFTLLYSRLLKIDAYILRIPCRSMVPAHNDPCPEGYEHHRVNITLRSPKSGGITYFDPHPGSLKNYSYRAPKHYHFRPDIMRHYVTAIMKGELWLLSFGWLRKKQ